MHNLSAPGHPFQYAWHVPKLESAIDYWVNTTGVGPFFINQMDSASMPGFRYRGSTGNLQMRVAWAQGKEGQIELIEVNSSEPNVYHDLVPKDKTAFHHVGIWSDDYAKDRAILEEQGYVVAMDLNPSNICYFDTSADNGCMLELIERNEGLVDLFGRIAKACEDWDGQQPVRTFAELMAG